MDSKVSASTHVCGHTANQGFLASVAMTSIRGSSPSLHQIMTVNIMRTLWGFLPLAAIPVLTWAVEPTVTQSVTNQSAITVNTQIPTTGALGQGASVSISASGAVGSVSVSGNGGPLVYPNDASGNGGFSAISQTTTNTAAIENGTTYPSTIEIGSTEPASLGLGASASISTTGAAAAVSVSANGAYGPTGNLGMGTGENGIQQSTSNSGSITGGATGDDHANSIDHLKLVGDGSSASISTSGASSSVSLSLNQTDLTTHDGDADNPAGKVSVGAIDQVSSHDGASVANYGTVTLGDADNDGLQGIGTSASITATGASSSVSLSSNQSTWDADTTPAFSGSINQVAVSGGTIADNGTITASNTPGTVTNSGKLTIFGGVQVVGGAASVTSTGALTSFSVSSLKDNTNGQNPISVAETPTQNAVNYSTISNNGSVDLGGGGVTQSASVSVGASGAVMSMSLRSIQ